MKKVIAKYLPIPNIPVQTTVPKGNYGYVNMVHVVDLFTIKNTPLLKSLNQMNISENPMTFEQMNQENGFVLYEHVISQKYRDPSLLTVTGKLPSNEINCIIHIVILVSYLFTCLDLTFFITISLRQRRKRSSVCFC